jgi:ATP-dependent helicase/nuclease subunit B
MDHTVNSENPYSTLFIPHGADFWLHLARQLIASVGENEKSHAVPDLSALCVMLPSFAHAAQCRAALATILGNAFIPPQLTTLSAFLKKQIPDVNQSTPSADSERLMLLYASLRKVAWLKELMVAHRNTDLLPLAKTLMALGDELTEALLPTALSMPQQVERRWQIALQRLSPKAAALLSDEAKLVWTIWETQRDARDPAVHRYAALKKAAASARQPCWFISSRTLNAFEKDFLASYAAHCPVQLVLPDWSQDSVPKIFSASWPELLSDTEPKPSFSSNQEASAPTSSQNYALALSQARDLEDEAQRAAQTVVAWMQEGKKQIAIIPQDRMVARRVRALLERADIAVSDETGWKLSTTRAAAVLAAWLELVASNAQTIALLDFLKSPFLFPDAETEAQQRMSIEKALVKEGVTGGWKEIRSALVDLPMASELMEAMAREAARFSGNKTITEWVQVTRGVFNALGLLTAFAADVAGHQILELMDAVGRDCSDLKEKFSLAEWRALINLELEQTIFVAPRSDKRVIIVPLHDTPLRYFDAVIILGGDAAHLPTPSTETLFFADVVRTELGLATRAIRHQEQCRYLAALLLHCPQVVLSWQSQRHGEMNPVSTWIQRLQLQLAIEKLAPLAAHEVMVPTRLLQQYLPTPPQPRVADLLPTALSASGVNTLHTCPYQFFASRLLKLSALDGINELPQKRDYGDWVHDILLRFERALQETPVPIEQQAALLETATEAVFAPLLDKNPAALGFYVQWKKMMSEYLVWAQKHAAKDWLFELGEHDVERELQWENPERKFSVRLHGRIDRIDTNNEQRMIIDYKTIDPSRLRKGLKQIEDHQLAFYGLMMEIIDVPARYVAFDKTKVVEIEAKPYAEWCAALKDQIQLHISDMAEGVPLPANGVGKACDWCEMRGLCRKGAW